MASARTTDHELPGIIRSLHTDGGLLLVGVSSRTNVELVLTAPTTVQTSAGPQVVDRVGLWVDEPRAVTSLLGAGGRRRDRTSTGGRDRD